MVLPHCSFCCGKGPCCREVLGYGGEFVSRAFSPLMLGEAEVCTKTVNSCTLGGLSRLQLNQLNVLLLFWVGVGIVGLLSLSTVECKDLEPAGLKAVAWASPVQTLTCLTGNQLRSDQAHQLWLVSAGLGYKLARQKQLVFLSDAQWSPLIWPSKPTVTPCNKYLTINHCWDAYLW